MEILRSVVLSSMSLSSSVILHLDPEIIGKKLKIGRDDDGGVTNYLLKLPNYPTSAFYKMVAALF